jgi:hypothetical protein
MLWPVIVAREYTWRVKNIPTGTQARIRLDKLQLKLEVEEGRSDIHRIANGARAEERSGR